jgi:hypothetical protein
MSKLMRMKKGFIDIPVGDFKVSHLSEHPSLDEQDLCVSTSLASAVYSLGFQGEAFRIEAYGVSDLQGGAVDALLWQGHLLRKNRASNLDNNKMCETTRDFQLENQPQ